MAKNLTKSRTPGSMTSKNPSWLGRNIVLRDDALVPSILMFPLCDVRVARRILPRADGASRRLKKSQRCMNCRAPRKTFSSRAGSRWIGVGDSWILSRAVLVDEKEWFLITTGLSNLLNPLLFQAVWLATASIATFQSNCKR